MFIDTPIPKQKQPSKQEDVKDRIRQENQKENMEVESSDLSQMTDEQVNPYLNFPGVSYRQSFSVIPPDETNQVLQLVLLPKNHVYVSGKIIYSNLNPVKMFKGYESVMAYLTAFFTEKGKPMVKLLNSTNQVGYFGIQKEGGGGKILQIDSQFYGNFMYINRQKLISSNLCHKNASIKVHSKLLSNLIQRSPQDPKTNYCLHILQAQLNNNIIEKELADGQQFYARKNGIVCLGESVKVSPMKSYHSDSRQWVLLQGPGWVFVENAPVEAKRGLSNWWILVGMICWVLLEQFLGH